AISPSWSNSSAGIGLNRQHGEWRRAVSSGNPGHFGVTRLPIRDYPCSSLGSGHSMDTCSHDELLICTIARMLEGLGHVAVGASSPIPGAAALLARARSGGRLRLSLLGSEDHNFFTDGGRELFDCAAQGRIDAFFLGGGQIDGEANVNLVGIG